MRNINKMLERIRRLFSPLRVKYDKRKNTICIYNFKDEVMIRLTFKNDNDMTDKSLETMINDLKQISHRDFKQQSCAK